MPDIFTEILIANGLLVGMMYAGGAGREQTSSLNCRTGRLQRKIEGIDYFRCAGNPQC